MSPPKMNYHEMSSAPNINYRKSGLLLSCVAAAIYVVLFIRGKHQPAMGVLAFVIALLALCDAWLLHKTIGILVSVGNVMHRFTNPLIFGLIYIVGVIPTSLVLKLLGKDVLHLRFDGKATSYWKYFTTGRIWKESFRNQF